MKIIVDELPKQPQDCLFCIGRDNEWHRCAFEVQPSDFNRAITLYYKSCRLAGDTECPYLKERK